MLLDLRFLRTWALALAYLPYLVPQLLLLSINIQRRQGELEIRSQIFVHIDVGA